ncbi:MAG TPA: 50S ribosomal protein L11 methyltransferase [Puia sp.]|nr:50S ribosomal protein L11 methyltransferase [Puia sp.]
MVLFFIYIAPSSIKMKNYYQIQIALKNKPSSDILVAQLTNCGFEGFEESDEFLYAFISEKEFDASSFEEIITVNKLEYTKHIIEEKNWNEIWEKSFDPVVVEDFCAIRASFHKPIQNTLHEIIITPKMSFGTGHHATTFLMLKAISTLDCKEKSILDFGTGTAVLAIIAEKCGAKNIVAIDNDDWSISNAKENIIENQCQYISLYKAESLEKTGVFHIILANINKNIITRHFGRFQQHLKQEGVLIISGLLAADYSEMERLANKNGFSVKSVLEKEDWICLILCLAH